MLWQQLFANFVGRSEKWIESRRYHAAGAVLRRAREHHVTRHRSGNSRHERQARRGLSQSRPPLQDDRSYSRIVKRLQHPINVRKRGQRKRHSACFGPLRHRDIFFEPLAGAQSRRRLNVFCGPKPNRRLFRCYRQYPPPVVCAASSARCGNVDLIPIG